MTSARAERPDVLICAGLDPSGGAGFIADVRVVDELGCRPIGVVTALTVQNTAAVIGAEAVSPDLVREQLEHLLSDVEVRAVKIGMLGSSDVARAIGRALALSRAPVVWDPVVSPSRGAVRLLEGSLADAVSALAPHLALVTPNAGELALLTGASIETLPEAVAAGEALAARLDCPVLVKGGHLAAGEAIDEAVDVLCWPSGPGRPGATERLPGPRVPGGEHVHGTGCALSSAIASQLARGNALADACRAAKAFVAARIASPVHPGRGAAAIV